MHDDVREINDGRTGFAKFAKPIKLRAPTPYVREDRVIDYLRRGVESFGKPRCEFGETRSAAFRGMEIEWCVEGSEHSVSRADLSLRSKTADRLAFDCRLQHIEYKPFLESVGRVI